MNLSKERALALTGLFLSVIFLAYGPGREESIPLLIGYGVAFSCFAVLLFLKEWKWNTVLWSSIGIRVALLAAPITWTDDHFRYIWDGICSINGIQPFAYTPLELVGSEPGLFSADLFQQLNSPDYYTVYPPVAQAMFGFAAWIGKGQVLPTTIVLRVISILCDMIGILLLRRVLSAYRAPTERVLWYALNPLVVLELTVNVHTEVLLMPLFFGMILLLHRRPIDSAVLLALIASIRLWPLLLLLAIPSILGIRIGIRYGLVVIGIFLLSWVPLWTPELTLHFWSSLRLFMADLEFNGGAYELLRRMIGDELVKATGLLPVLTFAALLAFTLYHWRKPHRDVPTLFFGLVAIHLFGSQAVHPWYIIPLIGLAAVTGRWWPLAWSLLIFPTYLTYGHDPYAQPYAWIAIEYMVLGVLIVGGALLRGRIRMNPKVEVHAPWELDHTVTDPASCYGEVPHRSQKGKGIGSQQIP
ncbi:MAG: DUF2029 domain-containing protein [Flavobacteriales bacterium]|nr:DUF2029 domain-containing protein [Flavobacteriales bacterium]